MKHISVYMAQPTHKKDKQDLSLTLIINQACPEFETLEQQDAVFNDQARDLCDALLGSLPDGLFDRLTGNMLAVKSTHFIVSHNDLQQSPG